MKKAKTADEEGEDIEEEEDEDYEGEEGEEDEDEGVSMYCSFSCKSGSPCLLFKCHPQSFNFK